MYEPEGVDGGHMTVYPANVSCGDAALLRPLGLSSNNNKIIILLFCPVVLIASLAVHHNDRQTPR